MELSNFRGKQNSITEALQIKLPEHAVISVTGSGGKTSLIFAWAKELAGSGKKVAITTTTHMLPHTEPLDEGITLAAKEDPEKPGKLMSPGDDVIRSLREEYDAVLIEADGSRGMPLKWPAPWEPVVPEYSDFTVCVAGLSALGRSTADVIYRAEDLPDRLKRDTVDVNLLHAMLSSREGGQKNARGEFRVFMNQVDDDIDRLACAYRMQQILGVFGIQSAWGSLKSADDLKIAVILEAAGNSKRFGSNKLLHELSDGRPMVSHVLDAVRPLDVSRRIIVTQYSEVAGMGEGFDIVMNEHPELGISRSMHLGIEAAGDADAYMFCVCDQPWLSTATLERLIEAYKEEHKKGTAPIVSLAFEGKMYNPKIFSSRYRSELMALSGDTGGRQIIDSHAAALLSVEAADASEVSDIDTPL